MSDETAKPKPKPKRWCCDGNAEDCALCDTGRLPYPWICPGDHDDSPANRGLVLKAATQTRDRDTIKTTMRRLRRHDQALAEAASGLCEEPHETIEAEDACEAARAAELSAIQAWAAEPDLAAALGSFGDGYRQAQRDAQAALALDGLTPREGHEGAEAGEHVYLSTGCLHGEHAYCQAKTGAVGAKTPATCKFCAAPCVCECHGGAAALATEARNASSVLSEAELREVYGKAIVRGLRLSGAGGSLAQRKVHVILSEVLEVRDRELARNRQRLALASQPLEPEVQPPAVDVEAVRLDERLKVLNEVNVKLMGECASPFERLAYHNVFLWLRQRKTEAETARKGLDTRSDG